MKVRKTYIFLELGDIIQDLDEVASEYEGMIEWVETADAGRGVVEKDIGKYRRESANAELSERLDNNKI